MKPIAVAVALAGAALLAAAGPSAAESPARESPAAAFERMLAPRAPATAPAPAGAPADPLTRAFNAALWNAPAPATHHPSYAVRPLAASSLSRASVEAEGGR
jgi:hypothetical protein